MDGHDLEIFHDFVHAVPFPGSVDVVDWQRPQLLLLQHQLCNHHFLYLIQNLSIAFCQPFLVTLIEQLVVLTCHDDGEDARNRGPYFESGGLLETHLDIHAEVDLEHMDHDCKDTMMYCCPRIVDLFQDALHAYLEQASRALFQVLALLRTDGVLVQGDMTPVLAARIEPCDEANLGAVQTVEDLGFVIVYQVLHCDHDAQAQICVNACETRADGHLL